MIDELATVFDADNHYWEASDAFTRYRSPEFAERGVQVKEVDGRMRYVVHGDLHPWIPGPGDANPRPEPGAFLDRSGRSIVEMLTSEEPSQHPEWFQRDARLTVMDAQGVEACWMFPSQGVCMEGVMQPDIEAILDIFRGFNRWLDDEWGYAYKDRIFAAPYLTLSDMDAALAELDRVLGHGLASSLCGRVPCSPRKVGSRRPTRCSIRSGRASPKPVSSWQRIPDLMMVIAMSRTLSRVRGVTRAAANLGRARP